MIIIASSFYSVPQVHLISRVNSPRLEMKCSKDSLIFFFVILSNSTQNEYYLQLYDALPDLDSKHSKLKKLELPRCEKKTYAHKTAIIAGFGDNWTELRYDKRVGYYNVGASTDRLKYGKVKILDNSSCQKFKPESIDPSHLCASINQPLQSTTGGACDVS